MKIVAFDLGSHMAWAHNLFPSGTHVTSVTYTGIRAHRAGQFMSLMGVLMPQWQKAGCRAVVYERPFGRGMDATRCLWGLAGIIEATASNAGMAVVDITPGEIKKYATGYGLAKKDAMLYAARQLGYGGTNEHEADAYLLLMYGEAKIQVKEEPCLLPLKSSSKGSKGFGKPAVV